MSQTKICQICAREDKLKKCPKCKRYTCKPCLTTMEEQGYKKHECSYCGHEWKKHSVFSPKRFKKPKKIKSPEPRTIIAPVGLGGYTAKTVVEGMKKVGGYIAPKIETVTRKDGSKYPRLPKPDGYDIIGKLDPDIDKLQLKGKMHGHSKWRIKYHEGLEFTPDEVYINQEVKQNPVYSLGSTETFGFNGMIDINGSYKIAVIDENPLIDLLSSRQKFDVYNRDKKIAENCINESYETRHQFYQDVGFLHVSFRGMPPTSRMEKPPRPMTVTIKK